MFNVNLITILWDTNYNIFILQRENNIYIIKEHFHSV